jgi:hypothetical protein
MHRLRALLLPFALTFTTFCGGGDDSSTGPTLATVAGTYQATQIDLTFALSGDVVDALELGASAEIVLTPQGTTSGTLVLPAVLTEDGIDDDVFDLTGTFTVSGNTVTFQGQGDNIIPTVPWTIGDGTLTASSTQSVGTVDVTLTRS